VIWKSVNTFVIPGSPALAPFKDAPVKTLGGDVSRGSMGRRFVAKYTLRIGHIREGLNSVVELIKFTLTPFDKLVD
jgi:hypothetical protein